MKRILISGGPVHAKLDDVKIITNKFKGGLMAKLADKLLLTGSLRRSLPMEVTYLCAKGSVQPTTSKIVYHDGVHDYMAKVLEMAPHMDAVILGGAVANLIPVAPFPGKFPSHNYKPGDRIPIDFTIAPRIIDEVKKVAQTLLFGFKLLSGVPEQELLSAAYGVLAESKAIAVIANDAKDLKRKLIITGVGMAQEYSVDDYHQFIIARLKEEYYKTQVLQDGIPGLNHGFYKMPNWDAHALLLRSILEHYSGKYGMNRYGKSFGSIAMRNVHGIGTYADGISSGFFTTARVKTALFASTFKTTEADNWTYVGAVNHDRREINVGPRKATLNAPLFDHLFRTNDDIKIIVHYHELSKHGVKLPYATPGTVQDSIRDIGQERAFEIDGHGTYLLFKNVKEALAFNPYTK